MRGSWPSPPRGANPVLAASRPAAAETDLRRDAGEWPPSASMQGEWSSLSLDAIPVVDPCCAVVAHHAGAAPRAAAATSGQWRAERPSLPQGTKPAVDPCPAVPAGQEGRV
jgi:hypothetical protein